MIMNEVSSQESGKRNSKPKHNHFMGRHLKNLSLELSPEKKNESKELDNDESMIHLDDITRCIYCGVDKFNETTNSFNVTNVKVGFTVLVKTDILMKKVFSNVNYVQTK